MARSNSFPVNAGAPRLAGRLQALVRAGCGPDRVSLSDVLKRIDETVLPRALTLTADDGSAVRLLISNRRLMRVEACQETTAGDDAPADPEAAALSFAARLHPVLGAGETVRLETARYSADAFFWDVGCSAGRLAQAMGARRKTVPVPAFDALIAAEALAQAETSPSGGIVRRSDHAALPGVLDALAEIAAEDAGDMPLAGGRRGRCLFLPVRDGLEAVIAARAGGRQTLAVVPEGLRDRVLTAWARESGADG